MMGLGKNKSLKAVSDQSKTNPVIFRLKKFSCRSKGWIESIFFNVAPFLQVDL